MQFGAFMINNYYDHSSNGKEGRKQRREWKWGEEKKKREEGKEKSTYLGIGPFNFSPLFL